MDMSSPSMPRLPKASEGPFWCPPPAQPRTEWREIEGLLAARVADEGTSTRRGIRSFAFVVVALLIGGGVLASTLIGSRSDCGIGCHLIAVAAPTETAVPHVGATAALASRSDARMLEGRSAAEPTADGATADTSAPSIVPPARHRHHHHRHPADF